MYQCHIHTHLNLNESLDRVWLVLTQQCKSNELCKRISPTVGLGCVISLSLQTLDCLPVLAVICSSNPFLHARGTCYTAKSLFLKIHHKDSANKCNQYSEEVEKSVHEAGGQTNTCNTEICNTLYTR